MIASAVLRWLTDRFELGRVGDRGNVRPMEGLRGIAVLMVFGVHYATLSLPWAVSGGMVAATLDRVHDVGNAGVDLFFVLSGFLIYGSLVDASRPYASYMRRRVRRIYPTFLVVFALYMVVAVSGLGGHDKLPGDTGALVVFVIQNLLLLPGLVPVEPLVTVAWSLSYEMFFYLVMPLIIAASGMRRRTPVVRVAQLAGLAITGLAAGAVWGGPVRLAGFMAGAILYESVRQRPHMPCRLPWATLAAGAVVAVMLTPMPGPQLQALRVATLCVAYFTLCLVCFSNPSSAAGRLASWTPLRWLGNMSYSYYLIHGFALNVLFFALGRVWPPGPGADAAAWLVLVAFPLTLLVGAALYLVVERPLSLTTPGLRSPASARRAMEQQS